MNLENKLLFINLILKGGIIINEIERIDSVQYKNYSSTYEFLNDVIKTLSDETNYDHKVTIISCRNTIEVLLEFIKQIEFDDFQFEIQLIEFRVGIDRYMISILDDGEVYVEPSIYEEFIELDGFLYLHNKIKTYIGKNKYCDSIVFDILE